MYKFTSPRSQISGALTGILSKSEGSIPCPSTYPTVTVEFNAVVVAASVDDTLGSATIGSDGSTVVFDVSSLEDNAVGFTAALDHCGATNHTDDIVASVSYSDNEGNAPDLSALEGVSATGPTCRESCSLYV